MRSDVRNSVIILLTFILFISNGFSYPGLKIDRVVCKNKKDGFHSYKGNCSKYIFCDKSVGIVLTCTSGFHFSSHEKMCVLPHEAKCAKLKPANHLYDDVQKVRTVLLRSTECARIVCFFNSQSSDRRGFGKFMPKYIDASLCTHIIYAYAKIKENELVVDDTDESLIIQVMEKKLSIPGLKVLLSVGGWRQGSTEFTKMVATPSSRELFIGSAIYLLQYYGFDGLDLAWTYPGSNGSPPEDKRRFTYLLREMRTAFDDQNAIGSDNKLLLTATVAVTSSIVNAGYEIFKLDRLLDFINLKTYNFHGPWDQRTGHNSPYSDVTRSVEFWVANGVSSNKLVIGLPIFGRSFTLQDETRNEYGAPATEGKPGQYTKNSGVLAYYEICKMSKKRGARKWLHEYVDPYLVYRDQWVSYDDGISMWKKVKYVRGGQYGGVMIWDVSMDDFRGSFCGKGRYPLLTEINRACVA